MRAIRLFGLALGILVWAAGNSLGFAQGDLPPVRTLGFGGVSSVVFSPDGRYLAVGTWGGSSVQLIDTSNWQVIRTFEGHTDGATSVAFSPDGKLLASGSRGPHDQALGGGHRKPRAHPQRPHPLDLVRGVQPRREAPRLRLPGRDDQAVGHQRSFRGMRPQTWAFQP